MMSAHTATTAAEPAAEKRLALLVCNGSFPNLQPYDLVGPAQDAALVPAVLSDPDTCRFDVRLLLDRGLLEVRREIARACAEAGEHDTLLIYYSGNGIREADGSLYLLVTDSEPEYVYATALDAEFILGQLRKSRCRKTVLLIDACYAGAFFANNRGIPGGLYAITSCGADEPCDDSPHGGPFTLALCAGLRGGQADADGDGHVSIDDLHGFIKQRLRAGGHTGKPQKWVWNVPEPIYIASVPRRIFLSYARKDAAIVDAMADLLQAQGFAVWIDREGIRSGNWKERVTAGLNGAAAVVLLLSASSLASDSVRKELRFAVIKRVPIIPVQAGVIPAQAFSDWFTLDYDELHRHVLDPQALTDGVGKLAVALRQLPRPAPAEAGAPDSP